MKNRCLTLLFVLALALSLGVSVSAAEDTVSFWPLPGESWTLKNPTAEEISLNTATNASGLAWVITDSDGSVTARTARDNSSASPVIPAGGQAIVMNRGLSYGLELDPRILAEKDPAPALLVEDLRFGESCEFQNITDHDGDVLLYSTSGVLSYVLFDAAGNAFETVTKVNSTGGIQDTTVQVPAGGRLSVICCTQGTISASMSSYQTTRQEGLCMARAANFTVSRSAEPALSFFTVFAGDARAYRNTSGKDCEIYGSGTYVLYTGGGMVESVHMLSGSATVPAGCAVSFGCGADRYGSFGVPAWAFEETELPGVVFTYGSADSFYRFENITGSDAVVCGASSGALFKSSVAPNAYEIAEWDTKLGGIVVPAGQVLVVAGSANGLFTAEKCFQISESAEPAFTTAVTKAGECFTVRNFSGSDQKIYVSNRDVSVRYAGTEYEWLTRSGNYYTIPSGKSVEVNPKHSESNFTLYGPYAGVKIERADSVDSASYYRCDSGDVFKVTNSASGTKYFSFAGKSIQLKGKRTVFVRVDQDGYLGLIDKSSIDKSLEVLPAMISGGDWHHIALHAGGSCALENTTDEMAWLYYSGLIDSRVYNPDGSLYSWQNETGLGMKGTNALIQIPAGGELHVTNVRGISTIDCRKADFTLKSDVGPVSVRARMRAGETWRYEWSSTVGISGAHDLISYEKIERDGQEVTCNLVGAADTAELVGWADCRAEKIADTPLYERVMLNAGETLRVERADSGLSVSYPSLSDPMLAVSDRTEAGPYQSTHHLSLASKQAHSFDSDRPSGFLYALTDGTTIRYSPYLYTIGSVKESPFFFETIPSGSERDYTALKIDGSEETILLFGCDPRYQGQSDHGFFYAPSSRNQLYYNSYDGRSKHVRAAGSDLLVAGLKAQLASETLPLRPTGYLFLDESGAESGGLREDDTATIRITIDAAATLPEVLSMIAAAYDENGTLLRTSNATFTAAELASGAVELPYTGSENVQELRIMTVGEDGVPQISVLIID